ncbi:MAG: YjbF family lipoprotein [Pseudomonadota bacterium]
MIKRLSAAIGALFVLISCSSNQGVEIDTIRETINIRNASNAAPDDNPVTQDSLKGITQKLIRVKVPRKNISFFAARIATNGDTDTYMSRAGQSVTVTGAAVIATRGLGFDLIGRSGGERSEYIFLDDDHKSVRIRPHCRQTALGSQHIEIAEIKHTANLLQERCNTDQGRHINQFWVARNGDPLRVHHWVGPELGIIEIDWLN